MNKRSVTVIKVSTEIKREFLNKIRHVWTDEQGQVLYNIVYSGFWKSLITIENMDGTPASSAEVERISVSREYSIVVDSKDEIIVRKRLFPNEYYLESNGFEIYDDFSAKNYSIVKNNKTIASVSKIKMPTTFLSYEIGFEATIYDRDYEPAVLSLIMAFRNVHERFTKTYNYE